MEQNLRERDVTQEAASLKNYLHIHMYKSFFKKLRKSPRKIPTSLKLEDIFFFLYKKKSKNISVLHSLCTIRIKSCIRNVFVSTVVINALICAKELINFFINLFLFYQVYTNYGLHHYYKELISLSHDS